MEQLELPRAKFGSGMHPTFLGKVADGYEMIICQVSKLVSKLYGTGEIDSSAVILKKRVGRSLEFVIGPSAAVGPRDSTVLPSV